MDGLSSGISQDGIPRNNQNFGSLFSSSSSSSALFRPYGRDAGLVLGGSFPVSVLPRNFELRLKCPGMGGVAGLPLSTP